MATTKLSATMHAALLEALIFPSGDGRYEARLATSRTREALQKRGKLDADGFLTEEGTTYLRGALVDSLSRSRVRDDEDPFITFFRGMNREYEAVAAFLLGDVTGVVTTSTSKWERGAHREELSAEDGIRQMGNVISNGQPLIEREDGSFEAVFVSCGSTVFTPVRPVAEEEKPYEVRQYRRLSGYHREHEVDMGLVGVVGMRARIAARGVEAKPLEDGVVDAGYETYVPVELLCRVCGLILAGGEAEGFTHQADGSPVCGSPVVEQQAVEAVRAPEEVLDEVEAAGYELVPSDVPTNVWTVTGVRSGRVVTTLFGRTREDVSRAGAMHPLVRMAAESEQMSFHRLRWAELLGEAERMVPQGERLWVTVMDDSGVSDEEVSRVVAVWRTALELGEGARLKWAEGSLQLVRYREEGAMAFWVRAQLPV